MNISLNWLSDYVDVALPAGDLGELFTRIGLNCEGITETESDIVFDLETTSNRPDWLGHLGVARELAAALRTDFRPPQPFDADVPVSGSVGDLTSVEVQCPDLCPRYTARVIRDVHVGPSPDWLVAYLEAVGMRSVNNVVDVTNFVLMEYAQPLHSFDYDKLGEHRIVVRRGQPGETLVSIDETSCALDAEMCIIADASQPVAIAGIMGGLNTEVTEATRNVLIESARFDPLATRKTSRKLGLMSESNYRFERGVDPEAVDEASMRACAMICELAGGTLAEGVVDVRAQEYQPVEVSLRPDRVNHLLGIDVPEDTQLEILQRLGFSPTRADGTIRCIAPPYRADIRREVDLIEEVARLHGFDQLPILPKVAHRVQAPPKDERIRRTIQEVLTGSGYCEAITFSFVDAAEPALFGFGEGIAVDAAVRRTNNVLRPTLLTSLLKACKTNQDAGNENVRLFELAAVFPPSTGPLPEEFLELAMVSQGDVRDLRGVVELLAERIAPHSEILAEPKDRSGFQPGTAAELRLADRPLGWLGRIAPEIQRQYGLEQPVAAAMLRYDTLAALAQLVRTTEPLPKFPPVKRDLSLIVDESVRWAELAEALHACTQPLRVAEEYVTTYRGKPVPPGRKSVTVSLEYRSAEGTLTSEQVDDLVRELLKGIQSHVPAELRT